MAFNSLDKMAYFVECCRNWGCLGPLWTGQGNGGKTIGMNIRRGKKSIWTQRRAASNTSRAIGRAPGRA